MRTCAYLNSLLDMFFSPGFSSYFPCSILNLSWWSYCLFCWENNSAQWRSWSSAQPSHLLCPGGLCFPALGPWAGPAPAGSQPPLLGPSSHPLRELLSSYTLSLRDQMFPLLKHSIITQTKTVTKILSWPQTHFYTTFYINTPQKVVKNDGFPFFFLFHSPLNFCPAGLHLFTENIRVPFLAALHTAPGSRRAGLRASAPLCSALRPSGRAAFTGLLADRHIPPGFPLTSLAAASRPSFSLPSF